MNNISTILYIFLVTVLLIIAIRLIIQNNRINRKIKNKFGQKYPFLKIDKDPMWNSCPFEGIRSSEIHPIIKEYFGNNTFIVFNKGYNCKSQDLF